MLFLVTIIRDRWFDDSLEDVMSDEEKGEFCKDRGSVVDGIDHTSDVKKVMRKTLFATPVNSNKWRMHTPRDKLRMIE